MYKRQDVFDGGAGADVLKLSTGSHVFSSDTNFANIETIEANTAGSSVNLSAQTEGFTITGGAGIDIIVGGQGDDIITGGDEADIITGGAGDDIITGGSGSDTFNIDADSDTITDLSESDILIISTAATANATISANYSATAATINDGTANLTVGTGGLSIDMSLASGTTGFNLIGSSGTDTMTATGKADTFTISASGEGLSLIHI